MAVEIVKTEASLTEMDPRDIDKLLQMDVNGLSLVDRHKYLFWLAKRKGLDPTTRPFDILIAKSNKAIVYANAGCADQLREIHNISVAVLDEGALKVGDKWRDDVYYVKVRASEPGGRFHEEVGCEGILNLTGGDLANAIQKAHTKASRRATLDLKGLGVVSDISELDGVGMANGARKITPVIEGQVVEK